ncbi:mannitol dehydrogenase [Tetragenococcus osmophilus]|uniref:Mannitol dehydrogenase n=1 Tax=Tetragenococcus osmophilus TaxID=526944 RepID=A0ABM7A9U3_9ENTE|nr:mannitol dehydrogenase [Tetragenococcus osmophilus]
MDKGGSLVSKTAIVYGAGQTGRGYAARYLQESGYQIIFIEKNDQLVQRLNEDKHYEIHFYHKDRTPIIINDFRVYNLEEGLRTFLLEADLIITSVGEENLHEVATSLAKHLSEDEVPQLLTCENGINPARVLKQTLQKNMNTGKDFATSQTAVFCSTVDINSTRLDILSQNETYFPYDSDGFNGTLDFAGAVPITNFENFLKRKIYTYNCLAGLISYLGYVKGYRIYSEAANDPEISKIMNRLLDDLNPALADYFDISLEEQQGFSQRALVKFKDELILDYVIKNGRAARRKLGTTERIYAPYKILKERGYNTEIMTLVAGAALTYLEMIEYEGEDYMPAKELSKILNLDDQDEFVRQAVDYYYQIKNKEQLQLLDLL